MWSPTHTQVTVQRARGLPQKGTNQIFVVIVLSKEKYQTSVKEKESDVVEWHEKCELKIPKQGNTAVLVLTALSPNFLGVDQFLGCVNIPLSDLDVYERPRDRWYDLQGKQSKGKVKDRGQLELRIGFSVKPDGWQMELNNKKDNQRSLGQLSHQISQNVSGSLASLGSVDKKTFRKLAKSITKKIKKDKKLVEEPSSKEDVKNLTGLSASKQAIGDADPGVISDDDEFAFDDLSHTGSGCSLEVAQINNNTSASSSIETVNSTNLPPTPVVKNNILTKTQRSVTPIQEKYVQKWEQKLQEAKRTKSLLNKSSERIVVGGETKNVISNRFSPGLLQQFSDKSKEELIELILQLQSTVNNLNKERKEMEDYIDNLLVRVIEKAPEVLQNPYVKKMNK